MRFQFVWLAMQCIPRAPGSCVPTVQNHTAKPKTDSYPCTCHHSSNVLNVSHQALIVGTPQKYLPTNGLKKKKKRNLLGKNLDGPFFPNLLNSFFFLQTGTR